MEPDDKWIGSHLQAARKKAGFKSAKAFAEHMGMNVYTYTDYEQGRHTIDAERLWQFADALGASMDDVAGRPWPPEGAESPSPALDAAEAALVADYRRCGLTGRATVENVARASAIASGEGGRADALPTPPPSRRAV